LSIAYNIIIQVNTKPRLIEKITHVNVIVTDSIVNSVGTRPEMFIISKPNIVNLQTILGGYHIGMGNPSGFQTPNSKGNDKGKKYVVQPQSHSLIHKELEDIKEIPKAIRAKITYTKNNFILCGFTFTL